MDVNLPPNRDVSLDVDRPRVGSARMVDWLMDADPQRAGSVWTGD